MKIKHILTISAAVALASVIAACSSAPAETTGVVESSVVEETSEAVESTETTVVTEESVPAEETVSSNEMVEIDSNLQLYANTFITNFVEQYFPDYDRDTSGIEQILDFVHINLKLNSFESISYETRGDVTFETFTEEEVQRIVSKYFGMLITDELSSLPEPPETYGDQPAGPYFADGKVWYEAADGESYNNIGIVNSISNPGDGTLILDFSIYSIDLDHYWSMSLDELHGLYALTPEQAAADPLLSLSYQGTATVGVSQSGEYYLIDYSVDNI